MLDRDELIAGYMQMLREVVRFLMNLLPSDYRFQRDDDCDLSKDEIEREVDAILEAVDYNQSGFIEYSGRMIENSI